MKIRVLDHNQEPGFEFRGAFVTNIGGQFTAAAWLGKHCCTIETKESLLDAGIASCNPVEPDPDWPLFVRVEITEFDQTREETLWECTADPKVVAAARKFHQLALADELTEGMEL